MNLKMSVLDKSIYFKGLLLLIKKDNIIAEEEKELMFKIGKTLGFEDTFINSSIANLMENEYITDDVPVFSNKLFAESFILDGLKLAFSDGDFSAEELEHLTNIARKNGIDREWLMMLIGKYIQHSDTLNTNEFLFVKKYLDTTKYTPVKNNIEN